jgi:hypothetical protein
MGNSYFDTFHPPCINQIHNTWITNKMLYYDYGVLYSQFFRQGWYYYYYYYYYYYKTTKVQIIFNCHGMMAIQLTTFVPCILVIIIILSPGICLQWGPKRVGEKTVNKIHHFVGCLYVRKKVIKSPNTFSLGTEALRRKNNDMYTA